MQPFSQIQFGKFRILCRVADQYPLSHMVLRARPAPASLHNRRLVGYAMNRWSKMEPIHRWLVDNMQ